MSNKVKFFVENSNDINMLRKLPWKVVIGYYDVNDVMYSKSVKCKTVEIFDDMLDDIQLYKEGEFLLAHAYCPSKFMAVQLRFTREYKHPAKYDDADNCIYVFITSPISKRAPKIEAVL